MHSHPISQNWIFLGDSLTEGVGSSRISYVNEFAQMIRNASRNGRLESDVRVNVIRLRRVDPSSISRFVIFNLTGFLDRDERETGSLLCLWNLASEGKTIETDTQWMDLLEALSPSLIVIFRGSLESIIRPMHLFTNDWPWWIPSSWRNYAAMDPRCYFSTTWWR